MSLFRFRDVNMFVRLMMFEDGWPIQLDSWYDEDFNDVVFEYDLKVTECHSQQMMETVGGKEELLLTLDVRAVGGIYPTVLGVVLDGLKSSRLLQNRDFLNRQSQT